MDPKISIDKGIKIMKDNIDDWKKALCMDT